MPFRFAIVVFSIVLAASPPPDVQAATAWPGDEWPHSEPEAQGMSSSELAAMLERIEGDNPGIRSVTVVRHGTVVLDARIAPFVRGDLHDIHSCTKSVLSAMAGIAIERGDLPGLDTPVLDLFPGYEIANLDEEKRAMTLGHLLTMSAGLATRDSYLHNWGGLDRMRASHDWAQYILDLPIEAVPGSVFEYSNCVSQLIAIILQKATGKSVEAYAREHLFGPVGIGDLDWQGSGADDSWGYSGLRMRPLDLARLGYLYLHGGEWDGSRVVPSDWVEASTSPQIIAGTLAESYGYQWWVEEGRFMMLGYGGQFVYVVPALDLVAVFVSALPQRQFFAPRSLLSNYVEPAVIADGAVPASPPAAARLDSLVQVLENGTVTSVKPLPEKAQSISGKTFEFEQNRMRLQQITLHFTPGSSQAELEFGVGLMAATMTIGLDGVFRISEFFGQRWACRGHWMNGETFTLEQEAPDKVLRRRATLTFEGDTLSFEIEDRINGSVEVYSARLAPPRGPRNGG